MSFSTRFCCLPHPHGGAGLGAEDLEGEEESEDDEGGVSEVGHRGRATGEGNGLLEAVKRNAALAAVVGDWVSLSRRSDERKELIANSRFLISSRG